MVESVEYDRLLPLQMAPNDPFFKSKGARNQDEDDLWGLKKMRLELAWDISQGAGVVVAVLDSGVDYKHKDLAENIWQNSGEVAGNGKDDDTNGLVDDVFGWDFWSGDADPLDEHGHGTHVAGTIAAVGENNEGIIGVAPKAKVMAIKGGDSGASVSMVAMTRGFLYAINNGADVASCSWGPGPFDTAYSPLLEEIIQFARRLGMVVVFAAGNNASVVQSSPVSLREVLAVGASIPDDGLAFFSNLGPRIGVVAPGGGRRGNAGEHNNILSLKASAIGPGNRLEPFVVKGDYLRLAGTSMATPHVSGLVALLLAKRPGLTVDDVVAAVQASCDDVGQPGFDLQTGFGRVNAAAALAIDSPLRMHLAAPGPNATLVEQGGKVAIEGAVSGVDLKEWRLAYSPLDDLGQAVTIGSVGTAPKSGLLDQWDIRGLPTGAYLLRLIAKDQKGRTFEDHVTVGRPGRAAKTIARSDRARLAADVSGDFVVWSECDLIDNSLDSSLQRRKLSDENPLPPIDLSGGFVMRLDLEGDWLVYELHTPVPGSPNQIAVRLCNLKSDLECESIAKFNVSHPYLQLAIGGGRVYWTDENDQVFYRELNAPGSMPKSLEQSSFSGLRAEGDYVVWTDGIDVMALNVRTEELKNLTQDGSPTMTGYVNANPSLKNGKVAWKRSNDSGRTSSIVLHDLSTGMNQVIADRVVNAGGLAVTGARVFWDEFQQAQQDVAMVALNGADRARITGDMANQFVIAADGTQALLANQRRAQVGDIGDAVYDLTLVEAGRPAKFLGSAHRQGDVEYTVQASPDGRTARLELNQFHCALDASGEPLVAKQDLSVALPWREEHSGASVRFVAKGVVHTPAGTTGTLLILAGGKTTTLDLTGAGQEFEKTLVVAATPGPNLTLSLRLVLERAAPATAAGRLELRSLDLNLTESP